jgi:hypothetical protein
MPAKPRSSSHRLRQAALAVASLAALATLMPAHAATADARDDSAVVLSFSTVGDSRQDLDKPDPTTLPLSGQDATWLQNTQAFSRIMRSIAAEKSSFLFFNGDMIMGYGKAGIPADTSSVPAIVGSDLMKFYRQYGFWRGMVAELMEQGTYVVPVPGNHETQWKAGGKKAQVENENAWRDNMGDLILDDARFSRMFGETPSFENVADNGHYDHLASDQSKLSYSFDFRGAHFAIINTDPVKGDAHAPTGWLREDFAEAKARGIEHFFVFGHKPAFTYAYDLLAPTAPAGLDVDPAARDLFWNLIEEYGATYFCGHEHIFNMSQPLKAQGGKAWQVLVGSGGSPFDAAPTATTANPATDRTYAWATIKVLGDGSEKIDAWGFDDQFGPTRHLQSVRIHPGHDEESRGH